MAMAQPILKPVGRLQGLMAERHRDNPAPVRRQDRRDDRVRWSGPRRVMFVLAASIALWGIVIAIVWGISTLIG